MKINLYYVVRQYQHAHEGNTKLDTPLYEAGPYSTHDAASYYIAEQWLYAEDFFAIVQQSIDVENV